MRRRKTGLAGGMWLVAALLVASFAAVIGCGGGGGDSAPAVTVPGAPSSLIANAGDNSVTLSWSSVAGADSYNIYRGTASGVTKTTGTKVSGVQSPNSVSGLTNGTAYYFVVTAVNAAGESGISVEKTATPSATPPPAAPGGVSAAPGNALATVSWSAVTGATSYNLYWATASGVTKATGTKIAGVTSPKDVTSLANGTKYYFVVTAVGAGGESAESAEVFATPAAPAAAFTQADLAGTWDGIFFTARSGSGSDWRWQRVVCTINGSGGMTVTSLLDSTGGTTLPAPGSILWTISAAGVVSESSSALFHGQMSSNKLLVIGTDGGSGNSAGLRVFRKRTGTVFTSADLANKTFTFHGLNNGGDNTWSYGAGTIDGSGLGTVTSEVLPSGTGSGGSVGTLSVSSSGIVTNSTDSSFYGLMTDDKKVVFFITTDSINSNSFTVLTNTGQTYTQSDYAGTWNFSTIRNTVANPYWNYGVSSVDAAGNATYLSFTDSLGSPTPADFTRILSASGVITDPANATAHGQMSYNKDLTVRTQTTSGRYQLTIGFK